MKKNKLPIKDRTILLGIDIIFAGWSSPLWGTWKRDIEERIEIHLGKFCIQIHWRNE